MRREVDSWRDSEPDFKLRLDLDWSIMCLPRAHSVILLQAIPTIGTDAADLVVEEIHNSPGSAM